MTTVNKKNVTAREWIQKLFPILFAVSLWLLLSFYEQYFLKKAEDLSLFLFDWDFLKSALTVPGGFLGWAASFFTQFLYLPWLGSIFWIALLMLSARLTRSAFGIPAGLSVLSYIPAFILVAGNMSLGYGVYLTRVQDFFFSPVLGYIVSLVPLILTGKSEKRLSNLLILAVWSFIGYPLAGIYALWGTLLAGLAALFRKGTAAERIAPAAVAAALFLLVPVLLYGQYTSYRIEDSWTMGLTVVSDDIWTSYVRLPFYLIAAFTVLAVLTGRPMTGLAGSDRNSLIAQIATIVLGTVLVWAFWFKDSNFRAELMMSQAVDRHDWKQVTDIYEKVSMRGIEREKKAIDRRKTELEGVRNEDQVKDIIEEYDLKLFEPTRLMVLYRDLALLKQNRALDQAFTYRDGSRLQKSRTQIPMTFQAGRQLYLNYGVVNMAYRWCLEDLVEHGLSFGTLKYIATYAVLMNETQFASKYLNKLDKSLFYRKWSRSQRDLAADAAAMSKAVPYCEIIPYMSFPDRMSNDHVKAELYLIQHFRDDRGRNASPEFDRAALLWAMRTQDIPQFWTALARYLTTSQDGRLPRHVQEAVQLYSTLESMKVEFPIEQEIKNSHSSFQKYAQLARYRNEQEAAFPFWLKYGKTFFYYYYFTRNLQTY